MKRHKGKTKQLRERILIMCEGETERNYFLAIKQDRDYKAKLTAVSPQVIKAKHPTPERVVKEAIQRAEHEVKEGNPYDQVWVVFDHDHHPHRRDAYDQAIREHMRIGFSALAFEMWYLLHFEQTAKIFARADQLEAALRKYIPTYQKAKRNDFSLLKPHLEVGYQNAAWLRDQHEVEAKHCVDQLAWTDVDELVKYLIG